jgi:hypothetical protein
MRLYVTEFNPNGTNDLVITNDDSQVVDYIPEATFGVRIPNNYLQLAIMINGEDVTAASENYADEVSELPETLALLTPITVGDLSRFLAVSPIDPSGDKVKSALLKHGVNVD